MKKSTPKFKLSFLFDLEQLLAYSKVDLFTYSIYLLPQMVQAIWLKVKYKIANIMHNWTLVYNMLSVYSINLVGLFYK